MEVLKNEEQSLAPFLHLHSCTAGHSCHEMGVNVLLEND